MARINIACNIKNNGGGGGEVRVSMEKSFD